jgi:hypothetical protein
LNHQNLQFRTLTPLNINNDYFYLKLSLLLKMLCFVWNILAFLSVWCFITKKILIRKSLIALIILSTILRKHGKNHKHWLSVRMDLLHVQHWVQTIPQPWIIPQIRYYWRRSIIAMDSNHSNIRFNFDFDRKVKGLSFRSISPTVWKVVRSLAVLGTWNRSAIFRNYRYRLVSSRCKQISLLSFQSEQDSNFA